MGIHAPQFHGLSVDLQHIASNSDLTNAYLMLKGLQRLVLLPYTHA